MGRRGNVINMHKINKFGMGAVDRLAGEGGEQFDLDKAYGEQINRLLTSFRNDRFYEAKLRAHRANANNKTEIQKYMELINRKMQSNFAQAFGLETKPYTEKLIDGNLADLKGQIKDIKAR